MHEVAADRVAPTHVPPLVAKRIVLVEKMILALEVHRPIGVVAPIPLRAEMELGSKRFRVGCFVRLLHAHGRDTEARHADYE